MELVEVALSSVVRMMEVWEFLKEKGRILRRLKLSEVDHLFDGLPVLRRTKACSSGALLDARHRILLRYHEYSCCCYDSLYVQCCPTAPTAYVAETLRRHYEL